MCMHMHMNMHMCIRKDSTRQYTTIKFDTIENMHTSGARVRNNTSGGVKDPRSPHARTPPS